MSVGRVQALDIKYYGHSKASGNVLFGQLKIGQLGAYYIGSLNAHGV